jgi:hypothetical protein
VNESGNSEGYLAIIINAKGIFQNKVKKRTWEIPYVKSRAAKPPDFARSLLVFRLFSW